MTLAWQTDLPPTEKIVLLALADSANDKGVSWPAVSELRDKSGVCERSVQYALRKFEASGWLTVHRRYKQSNIYELHLDRTKATKSAEGAPQEEAVSGACVSPEGDAPQFSGANQNILGCKSEHSEVHPVRPLNPKTLTSLSLNEPSKKNRQREPSTRERARGSSQAEEVFDHWKAEWNHPRAVLDAKRRGRIEGLLKTFSPDDLRHAISGFKNSDWHTGRDPRGAGTVYDGIETLLRDSAQVEKGMRLFAHPPRPPPKPETASERIMRLNGGDDSRIIDHEPDTAKFLESY